MTKITYVWGPNGIGKTHNKNRIAKALGADTIIDGGGIIPKNAKHVLVLANRPEPPMGLEGAKVLTYFDAMCLVSGKGL